MDVGLTESPPAAGGDVSWAKAPWPVSVLGLYPKSPGGKVLREGMYSAPAPEKSQGN